jgi:hypothetical protein
MENTHDFVENVHDKQKKDKLNKKHQGKGTPADKLSNKQHSTNK